MAAMILTKIIPSTRPSVIELDFGFYLIGLVSGSNVFKLIMERGKLRSERTIDTHLKITLITYLNQNRLS